MIKWEELELQEATMLYSLCCFSFFLHIFFLFKENRLKGLNLIRLLKDKNCLGFVQVEMGSSCLFLPRLPLALLNLPGRLRQCLPPAPTLTMNQALGSWRWRGGTSEASSISGSQTVLPRTPSGAKAGCEGRREPNCKVPDALLQLEQLNFYLLGFCE